MTIADTIPEGEQKPESGSKEYNFAQIRQQLAEERAARMQAEEEAKLYRLRMEEAALKEEEASNDEPYIDRKALERRLEKERKSLDARLKKAEEELEKSRTGQKQLEFNSFLKENSDFHALVTPDKVNQFAEKNQRIASSIMLIQDPIERQMTLYEAMKNDHRRESSAQEMINKNQRHPGLYSPTGGNLPFGSGGQFTDADKKNAYQKMQELLQNKSF